MKPQRQLHALLLLSLLAALLAAPAAGQLAPSQPGCRVFKKYGAVASGADGVLMDSIEVNEPSLTVGTLSVHGLSLAHPWVAAIAISLAHAAAANTAPEAVATLKPPRAGGDASRLSGTGFADDAATGFPDDAAAAPWPATFKPQAGLRTTFGGKPAAGVWTLRVADLAPGAEGRVATLTAWGLTICPAGPGTPAVQAADGPSGPPVPPPLPQAVNVSISRSGIAVNVSKDAGSDGAADPDFRMQLGAAAGPDNDQATSRAAGLLHLLFPAAAGLSAADGAAGSGSPFIAAVGGAKAGVRAAVGGSLADAFAFAANTSEVYKNFVNKKIADQIEATRSGASLVQQLLLQRGPLLHRHTIGLGGGLAALRDMLVGDTKSKVDFAIGLAGQLKGLTSSVGEDLASTAGLVRDAAITKLGAAARLYTTVEGAAKLHVDQAITARIALLDGFLDKIIGGLNHATASPLSGPVADFSLTEDRVMLEQLQASLNKVAAAVEALPTPSQAFVAKVAAFSGLVADSPAAQFGEALGWRGPVMRLLGKVQQAQGLLAAQLRDAAADTQVAGNTTATAPPQLG